MIQYLHSGWAYFTLLIIIFTVFYHFFGLIKEKLYDLKTDFRLALFTVIVTAIQLLLGIANYFTSDVPVHIKENGFGQVMKISDLRLAAVEHPFMGILGFLFLLYGFRRMYYQPISKRKYLSIIIFYTLALLLFLSRIPWSKW